LNGNAIFFEVKDGLHDYKGNIKAAIKPADAIIKQETI
jgi:hypothetical protein